MQEISFLLLPTSYLFSQDFKPLISGSAPVYSAFWVRTDQSSASQLGSAGALALSAQ